MSKSLGRIAYEAAAQETGCTQPWEEANQPKWEAAAKAVADEVSYVKDAMLHSYRGNLRYCEEVVRRQGREIERLRMPWWKRLMRRPK